MTERTISPAMPGESKFVEVEGTRMHYVEEGAGSRSCSSTAIPPPQEDRPHEIGEAIGAWYRSLGD